MNNYRIPAIANTCAIFQLLTSTRKPMSTSEIAKTLDLPRTSVFRVLRTLEEEGMVHTIGKNYVMGHRLINLGLQVISQIPERQICVPILQKLTKKTQESSHFAILSGANSLLIEVCDSSLASKVASRPGTLADMHCSSSGKCMLAYAVPIARDNLLDRITFTQRTKNTHKNKESLLPELEIIRKQGYAVDEIEYNEGVRCIGAPAFNTAGQVIGVIGITASSTRFTKSRIPEMAEAVKLAAQELSHKLTRQ